MFFLLFGKNKLLQRIAYKVAVLAYRCQHGLAATYRYLRDELSTSRHWIRRLPSALSTSLDVRRTRLSTVSDRAFPVTAVRLWNSLPSHSTAAPLSPSSAVVLNHISSHFLISLADSSLICTVPAQWLVILDIMIVFTCNILTFTVSLQLREKSTVQDPLNLG